MTAAAKPATMPPISEKDFQRQVTDLAELFGWSWAHFRPAQTARGWRTPVSGPLGAGFPDLVLVNPTTGRLIFAELKRDGGKLTPDQSNVLEQLNHVQGRTAVYVWRPADLDAVMVVLRG